MKLLTGTIRPMPTDANQTSSQLSLMGQRDCVILPQLSARLSLRQGQPPATTNSHEITLPPQLSSEHSIGSSCESRPYYLPGVLEASIDRFVDHYNHRRYYESLKNLTSTDVYFRRGQTILLEREKMKRKTIQNRRLQHPKKAA